MSHELQDQFHELMSRQRTLVLRFARAIQVLIALEGRLTTAQALTFLGAWAEEGLPVSVLARRCDFPPYTVSQHLRALSDRIIKHNRGLGLLTVDYRQERADFRLCHVFLTKRGHLLAQRMTEELKDNRYRRILPMGELNFPNWPDA
ncbi:hypothetical protein [Bradyrhizobium sp. USDA 4529]